MDETKKFNKYEDHQKVILNIINNNFDYFVNKMRERSKDYWEGRDDFSDESKERITENAINVYKRATQIVKHILENERVEDFIVIKNDEED